MSTYPWVLPWKKCALHCKDEGKPGKFSLTLSEHAVSEPRRGQRGHQGQADTLGSTLTHEGKVNWICLWMQIGKRNRRL